MADDEQTEAPIAEVRDAIDEAITDVASRKEARDPEDYSEEWDYMAATTLIPAKNEEADDAEPKRSIFDRCIAVRTAWVILALP